MNIQFARGLICVTLIAACAKADAPSPTPARISWDQAKAHLNETVTVSGPVITGHVTRQGHVLLYLGKDYPDPNRFTVYIPANRREGIPTGLYWGQSIAVTGKIILYNGSPEIEVAGARDIVGPDDFAISKTLKLAPVWRWGVMAVNASDTLLYIPQFNKTSVINIRTGKLVANLSSSNSGACAVALVPEVGRGFVSNCWLGSVTVFDLKSHALLGAVDLGGKVSDAGPMIYDPFSKRLIVCRAGSRTLMSFPADIDLKNGKASSPIPLDGEPQSLVADGQGMVYVALYGGQVAVVDTRSMKVATTWPIEAAGGLTGISMDRLRSRLFVGCQAGVVVLSATDGHELARLPIRSGGGVSETAFFDGKAFALSHDGSLTLIGQKGDGTLTNMGQNNAGAFEVQKTLRNGRSAGGAIALNPTSGILYLSGSEPPPTAGEKHSAASSTVEVFRKGGTR